MTKKTESHCWFKYAGHRTPPHISGNAVNRPTETAWNHRRAPRGRTEVGYPIRSPSLDAELYPKNRLRYSSASSKGETADVSQRYMILCQGRAIISKGKVSLMSDSHPVPNGHHTCLTVVLSSLTKDLRNFYVKMLHISRVPSIPSRGTSFLLVTFSVCKRWNQ